MTKPKKTLKQFGRLEKLLGKQTARTAKFLSRRAAADGESPSLASLYDRVAERHAAALADLSEVTRETEALGLRIVEEAAAKSARKKATKASTEVGPAGKPSSNGRTAPNAAGAAPRTGTRKTAKSASA